MASSFTIDLRPLEESLMKELRKLRLELGIDDSNEHTMKEYDVENESNESNEHKE